MAGKKISEQPLVVTVNGSEKMPTGEAGDLTISVDQIKNYVLSKTSDIFSIESVSLPDNEHFNGSFSSPSLVMLHYIATNTPIRVRLYHTEAQRDADLNRPLFNIQSEGSGLIFEFISDPVLLSAHLSPTVVYFANTIYYSVTNISGSTSSISCDISYITMGV